MTGGETLERLRELALAAGAADLVAAASELEERVRQRRFHVACVGQFKRGKSTLLNALVGDGSLPTGVAPVTSVPTLLRLGRCGARVRSPGGWTSIDPSRLSDFVTERDNPGNHKRVLAAEVCLPAALLKSGLCLIDTPGLGSVFEANSVATRQLVPQIDAALVVLGADPPISGEECRLVESIAAEVNTLLFVVNKADRVGAAELDEAVGFIRQVLATRLGWADAEIYKVWAVGGGGGPDWAPLQARLKALAVSSRAALVEESARRGIARIGVALNQFVREHMDALSRPVAESQRRVDELAKRSRSVEQSLRELGPLFTAEEQRLSRAFEGWAEAFVREAVPAGCAALRTAWLEGRFDRASREDRLAFANRLARDLVSPWLQRSEAEAEAMFAESAGGFIRLANEHLARLATAAELDGAPLAAIAPGAEALKAARHFAFSDRLRFHYPSLPWSDFLEAALPRSLRRLRRFRRAERYLIDLLEVNASRVVGDLTERTRESRREIQAEIRESLGRTCHAAGSALEWARRIRSSGAAEIALQLDRLRGLLVELELLLGAARHPADQVPVAARSSAGSTPAVTLPERAIP